MIAMLSRTEGATIPRSWRRQAGSRMPRAGALKKRLGLIVASDVEERERVYVPAAAADEHALGIQLVRARCAHSRSADDCGGGWTCEAKDRQSQHSENECGFFHTRLGHDG